MHLLARFHRPDSGAILWDGEDVEVFELTAFRTRLGLVTQESKLFNTSVAENIQLGSSEPGMDTVSLERAASASNSTEFIDDMDGGWDAGVGDGGNKLSGGQRQRLSIARALYKDPPVLLMDEATSSLDTESEHKVQQAIDRLMEGRTTLVIAHRLSTVRHADRIIVLDAGRVAETGTHDELMQNQGLYRKLVDMQNIVE